jgi:hypothetical protein
MNIRSSLEQLLIITHIRDYNTRFSGINADNYTAGAVRTLDEVRGALDKLINSETIIIGYQ